MLKGADISHINLKETFQAVLRKFAFFKKPLYRFQKLQFLSGGNALYIPIIQDSIIKGTAEVEDRAILK